MEEYNQGVITNRDKHSLESILPKSGMFPLVNQTICGNHQFTFIFAKILVTA